MLQLLILAVLLLVMPLLAGGIFVNVDKREVNLPFLWISGQICLWAGFQLICVPLVLMEGNFLYVLYLFTGYSVLAAALGVVRLLLCWKKRGAKAVSVIRGPQSQADRSRIVLWIVFAAVLLFQLVQAVRMTYADGDDAFYVAISTIVQNDEVMYRKLPYTGDTTELDLRHGLAPFPVWIAYLARLSGMEAVSVAHLVLTGVLIALSYGVFYLLGRHLFPGKDGKLPLFMLFTELLVLFGDYSFYTVENFMIARSRQGKAALGSIVIPFLFYLLLVWLKSQEKQEKLPAGFYALFFGATLSACLCSTLGALLICMLAGIVGFLGAACYKRWGLMIPIAVCCIPCVCYAAMYLFLE